MKLAICKHVVNKSNNFDTLAYKFQNCDLSQDELAHEINLGHAFTQQHTGGDSCQWHPTDEADKLKHRCEHGAANQHRRQENFLCAGEISLDFDNVTAEQAKAVLESTYTQIYAGITYNTPSYTEENPRFRIIFELESPITNAEHYRKAVQALMWRYDLAVDESCKDPCRFFYGSKGSNPVFTDRILTNEALGRLIEIWQDQTQTTELALKPVRALANPLAVPVNPEQIEGKKRRWGRTLETMCSNLANAPKGDRHNTLVKYAVTVGGYIAGEPDVVDPYEARLALENTYSRFDGLNKTEMNTTLNWGIEKGKGSPLEIELVEDGFKPFLGERPAPVLVEGIDLETGEIIPVGIDDVDLVYFTADDEGNAQAFIKAYGNEFKYCNEIGWLVWTGSHWESKLAESKIDKKVVEVLRRRRIAAIKEEKEDIAKICINNRSRINACLQGLERRLAVEIDGFDADPNLLNCKNGVVNLRTGGVSEHNHEQLFTYCLATEYDPKADISKWVGFIEQTAGNGPEVKKYLQMAVGYTLTGYTSEECLFFLHGPSRSGKGTFTETLMELLGEPLSKEVSFSLLTGDKTNGDGNNFELAPLKPARAVFASESQRHERLNSGRAKSVTGGNKIYCCYKHKPHFNYQPQFKIWLSSNWPVNADVDDTALWGRVRVIEFPNSHLGDEDKLLKIKMKQPENLKGVLAWAVAGAIEWFQKWETGKGLGTPKAVIEWTDQQRMAADFVQQWLNESIEADATYWASNSDISRSYKHWCEENNTQPKGAKMLAESLASKGFFPGQLKRNGERVERGVQGLRIL